MGLDDEVDGIVYSAKAGSKKPQFEFFRFAEKTTGFGPNEMLLVDDTILKVGIRCDLGQTPVGG